MLYRLIGQVSAQPWKQCVFGTLHRLIVAKAETVADISAEEARAMYGGFDKIKINFQDVYLAWQCSQWQTCTGPTN